MKIQELFEAVHRVGSTFSKMGSLLNKARAFDKVNPKTGDRPDRSTLSAIKRSHSQDQKYTATDISEDPDYTMVLVVGEKTEPYGFDGEEYFGVNVLFYPSGAIKATTTDKASAWQWKNHKEKIIAAAKKSYANRVLAFRETNNA